MRGSVEPLVIHKASDDPRFVEHPGLTVFGVESYVAVPLHRRDGSYFGTLCVMDTDHQGFDDDILPLLALFSDLIAFELEADELQHRQQDALRQLEEFIAVARHDLRQVLTLLYGWAQLLDSRIKRGAESDELEDMVDSLLNSSREAVLLSETLLDTAMVETGSFDLDVSNLDLCEVVHSIVQDVRMSAPSHTIEAFMPPDLPISADRHRLGQVLRNVLDNAVKYVPASAGPVTVDVRLSPHDPTRVAITVQDAGAGVPDNELSRLFDQHFRASSAKASGARGSGLGLYVVRQIVEAHSGTVNAGRSPDGGLEIRMTLPTG